VSLLYLAVMLRLNPLRYWNFRRRQPAIAAAIRKNARPAYAYCFRLAASFTASTTLSIAKTAASHARKYHGALRGAYINDSRGSEEIAVVKVAVQEAPALLVLQRAYRSRRRPRGFELPFIKLHGSVGPRGELLLDETTAVNVDTATGSDTAHAGCHTVVVVAWVMVTESVLLLACDV